MGTSRALYQQVLQRPAVQGLTQGATVSLSVLQEVGMGQAEEPENTGDGGGTHRLVHTLPLTRGCPEQSVEHEMA